MREKRYPWNVLRLSATIKHLPINVKIPMKKEDLWKQSARRVCTIAA